MALHLTSINLYHEQTAPTLDAGELAGYLSAATGCADTAVRASLILEQAQEGDFGRLAELIASAKVRDLDSPFREAEPAYAEVEFERRRLRSQDRGSFGLLYDGFRFQTILRSLIPQSQLALDRVYIALTNRTLGTWEENDRRYHLRTILLGVPAVISTSGLVEAPAKPREFYLAQQQLGPAARSEYALALLKEQFEGRFLDHDDPRLTEVAKGYAVQAIAYQLTGDAFCADPSCRLYNAHWQEEMLHAQLEKPEYCPRHRSWLEELRRG